MRCTYRVYLHYRKDKIMKVYKVRDVKNNIYMITKDILLAQLEVLRQTQLQHVAPLSIFISVKTI